MTASPMPLLIPEDGRLLHIGPQKTGSTALQAAVQVNRERLRELGVTAVGTERVERLAVWAALMHPDSTEERYRDDFDRWETLVAEVARAPGRVLVSNESIGKADAEGARRIVDALGDDRVHVLAVARRLDRLLPSQWQQRVKMNATTLSYDQWLEVVLGDHPDDPVWRNIWVPHDLEALVARWTDAAAPERFTLLVADESDSQLLSQTVEKMVGLPAGTLRPKDEHKRNVSMSYGRLEVVRMLNERLGEHDIDPGLRRRVLRAIKQHPAMPAEQRVPDLPGWAHAQVAEMSAHRADLVSALGVRVVGDPNNLRLPPRADGVVEAAPALIPAELAANAICAAVDAGLERERALGAQHHRPARQVRERTRRSPRGGNRSRVNRIALQIRRGLRRG